MAARDLLPDLLNEPRIAWIWQIEELFESEGSGQEIKGTLSARSESGSQSAELCRLATTLSNIFAFFLSFGIKVVLAPKLRDSAVGW